MEVLSLVRDLSQSARAQRWRGWRWLTLRSLPGLEGDTLTAVTVLIGKPPILTQY
jgi:phosphoglycerate dehydrogenase-like enzyme